MNYAEKTHAEHLRLSILRLLKSSEEYSLNDSLISDALPALGFKITRDRVRTALSWLQEQGLVSVEEVHTLKVASLTESGLEVALGRRTVDGVKRPTPSV